MEASPNRKRYPSGIGAHEGEDEPHPIDDGDPGLPNGSGRPVGCASEIITRPIIRNITNNDLFIVFFIFLLF